VCYAYLYGLSNCNTTALSKNPFAAQINNNNNNNSNNNNDNISETGLCLRFQVEPTHLGPIYRASLCLRTGDHEKTETEYSF
jgi:hypothetical protein